MIGGPDSAQVPSGREGAGPWARARAEVWAHLPAWMYLFYACLIFNSELTNLRPPRLDLAYTVVFPLLVFLAIQAARAFGPRRQRGGARLFLVSLGLSIALPALLYVARRPSPLGEAGYRLAYELSNFVFAGLFAYHAHRREKSLVPLFFGVTLAYGVLLENGGILLGFFSETWLRLYLPPFPAPLATMVGWSMVAYLVVSVVWELRAALPWLARSTGLSAIAVSVAGVLLDLQIDPVATAIGCWRWAPSLPPAFEGVPLVNFIAWATALLPFGYALFRFQTREGIADGGPWSGPQLRRFLIQVPLILAAASVLFLLGTAVLEGPRGPSWTMLLHTLQGVVDRLIE